FVAEDEHAERRLGAEEYADGRPLEERVSVEETRRILDALRPGAEHAPRRDTEAGCVRDDCHLGRDLRAVGERRDHLGPLEVRLGEPALRLRSATVVEQALDIAGEDRWEAGQPALRA